MLSFLLKSAPLIAALLLISAPLTHARPAGDEYWDPHFGLPGPVAQDPDNRRVAVIKLVGNEIYLGGAFEGIGHVNAPGIAHWDGAKWESLGTGVQGGFFLAGSVDAILVEGTDVYVGGIFYGAGGVDAPGVAKWNGSEWSALGDGIDVGSSFIFDITSLVRYSGQLCAAGWRQIGDSDMVPVIAMWDGVAWTSVNTTGYVGKVYCMETDGQYLYLGGRFQNFSIPPLSDAIVRWDGTALTTMGDGLEGVVFDLEFFNGQLHAAGNITNSGVTPIRDLAAWNGASWSEVGDGIGAPASAELYSLAARNGVLYVAGNFDHAGSVASRDLAWWDGSLWHAYPGAPIGMSVMGNSLSVVTANNENVFVSGYFTSVDGVVCYGLGRWDGTRWFPLTETEQYGTNDQVGALISDGSGGLYAGGDFVYAGNTAAAHVMFFDGGQCHALGSGLNGSVWALEHSGSNTWAGGSFTTAGGVAVKNLACWDGTTWHDVGGGVSGTNQVVFSIHSHASDLYVGGQFSQAGSVPAANIAKWDGTTWQALGSGTNGGVLEIMVWNGLLYAGGNFTVAGGAAANHVASWDGTNWTQVGAGLSSGVNGFAVFNDELYASGSFTNSGGQPMIGIAKWNGSTWVDVGGGVGSQANDIEAVADGVYACGPFQTAGGATHIAKWNGTQWEPLGAGLGQWSINALAVVDNFLYVGGDFARAGDKASSCLARWNLASNPTGVSSKPALRASLGPCIPNPFNPSTTIQYSIAKPGPVTLTIYDVAGRRIRALVNSHSPRAETLTATWDGKDDAGRTVASGVYFCRMVSAGFSDTRKMVLLK